MWSKKILRLTPYPPPPLFHTLMQAISFGSSWEYNNDCIVHKLDTKSIPYIPGLRFISLVKERKEENSVLGTKVILSVSYQGHGPESKKRSPRSTWFFGQILLVSTIGNVERTVWRICILMLGCKGQVGKHSSKKKKKKPSLQSIRWRALNSNLLLFTVIPVYSCLMFSRGLGTGEGSAIMNYKSGQL